MTVVTLKRISAYIVLIAAVDAAPSLQAQTARSLASKVPDTQVLQHHADAHSPQAAWDVLDGDAWEAMTPSRTARPSLQAAPVLAASSASERSTGFPPTGLPVSATATWALALDAEYEYRRHDRLGSILNSVVERFERHRSAADRVHPPPAKPRPKADADAPAQQAMAERRSATLAAAERAAATLAPMRLEGSEGLVAVTFHIDDPAAVDAVADFVDEHGGSARNRGEDYIEAYVPVALLAAASQQPGVARVRAIIPPEFHRGSFVSQGVRAHKANTWHAAGYTGDSVKVGIVDGGFRGFSGLMGSELPSTVHVRCYASIGEHTDDLSDCETETGHGTAVAESLLDIAPDVELYISNVLSRADKRAATDWMVSQGVQIISSSIGWVWDGPGDGTSPISVSPLNTIDAAVRGGAMWANSAGNVALASWYGPFKDANGDGWHEFDNTANRCNMVAASGSVIQLRWADRWPGAATDLNLVVFSAAGGTMLAESGDPQRGPGSDDIPLDGLFLSGSGRVCVAVQRKSGPVPAWVQLQVFKGGTLETYTSFGSLDNPAESANPSMLTVGAAPYNDTHTIENFSSRGPTPDGRLKPDLVGADGATTATLPRFFGTSQSTPHVAGMAALLLSAGADLTPRELADRLRSTAVDRGPGGNDNTWGYGFAEMPQVRMDADLLGWSITDSIGTPLTLSPAFASHATRYTGTVAATTTQLTVFPFRNTTNTRVEISPADADSDPLTGHQVDLLRGSNDIVIAVTGNQGTRKRYRITVRRGTADIDLASLLLSRGRLDPGFSPGTHAYTSRVGDRLSATRTTVTAEASDATATVTITPADIDARTDGHQVTLAAGANVIQVQVASSTLSKMYSITVTRAAAPANHAPMANAGPNQTVEEVVGGTLAGGGTDMEGSTLSCRWRQTGGVKLTLDDPNACNSDYVTPNLLSMASSTLELVVNDGAQDSETADELVVTITADNDPPLADAGPDVTMAASSTVTLVGDGSADPEGQDITYSWRQQSGVSVTIDNSTSTRATFRAPAVATTTTLVFALTVNDGTHNSAPDTVEILVSSAVNDYDLDEDGLIEINTVAQLDAVRHDLVGTGRKAAATSTPEAYAYGNAFPDPASGMGCPAAACRGYELAADLDLNVAPHNADNGWTPIGIHFEDIFNATFQGNGRTIANLFIDISTVDDVPAGIGLFGVTGPDAEIVGATVSNPNIQGQTYAPGSINRVGVLVGVNAGKVVRSRVVGGVVAGFGYVGGLAGSVEITGRVVASHSSATVRGIENVGGLVGVSRGGGVVASYATGYVSGNEAVGGLVGYNSEQSTITASYATGRVVGNFTVGGLVGHHGRAGGSPSRIIASYATGPVTANARAGGLAGLDVSRVVDSYYDTDTTGQRQPPTPAGGAVAGGLGKTSSELQTPTDYADIYVDWNVDVDDDGEMDDPWSFGTASQYPVLRYDGLDTAAQFAAQGAPAGADLGTLTINTGTREQVLDGSATSTVHAVNVARTVTQLTVTAVPANSMDQVSIMPADADGMESGHQVALRMGVNNIAIQVTSAAATRTYVLNVARGAWDTDHDGYIEVSNVAQFNAMRYDWQGNGYASYEVISRGLRTPDIRPWRHYGDAFDSPPRGVYCAFVCLGYELTADIDLDIAPYNTGQGWEPLGYYPLREGDVRRETDPVNYFSGSFKGNGHSISNLYISRPASFFPVGLFTAVLGRIEGARLRNVNIQGNAFVGGLAGIADDGSTIVDSYVTGVVRGTETVGGLVGQNSGFIAGSFASVFGESVDILGGLAGLTAKGGIVASYARGLMTANRNVGGLVGVPLGGRIDASYSAALIEGKALYGGLIGGPVPALAAASYWDTEVSRLETSRGGTGLATSGLQGPTTYGGVFADWNVDLDGDGVNDDPWDFGTSAQYPVLKRIGSSFQLALQTLTPATELATLGLSSGTLHPSFASEQATYATIVDTDVVLVTLAATLADGASRLTVIPRDADPRTPGHQVRLVGHITNITIVVTATDGSFRIYLIRIARDANDTDFDNRIEISTVAQLNAMRWDADGDGLSDFRARIAAFTEAFGDAPITGLVCPTGCAGYELVRDLDLAGVDWVPIGLPHDATRTDILSAGPFGTVFDGNGHTISNLTVDSTRFLHVGLFAELHGADTVVRGLGLIDVNVHGERAGGLAGWNRSTIASSYVTGSVSAASGTPGVYDNYAGGLVAQNNGVVSGSWSAASVSAPTSLAGGLIGVNTRLVGATFPSGIVRASYAVGDVSGGAIAGGLVAFSDNGAIEASYAAGAVTPGSDPRSAAGGLVGFDSPGVDPVTFMPTATSTRVTASYWDTAATGIAATSTSIGIAKTTAELRSPTGYTGIYSGWNLDLDGEAGGDDPWEFGSSSQYPVLRYGRLADFESLRHLEIRSDSASPRTVGLTPTFSRATSTYAGVYTAKPNGGPTRLTVLPQAGNMSSVVITPADADAEADGHQLIVDRTGAIGIQTTTVDGRTGKTYAVTLAERPNRPPDFRLQDVDLPLGWQHTIDLTAVVVDPDSDSVSYAVENSHPDVVEVRLSGTQLLLTAGLSEGSSDVTVTAMDTRGATAAASIVVRVFNQPPEALEIADMEIPRGSVRTVDLAAAFRDPEGDPLSYEAHSADPSVLGVEVSGATLELAAKALGATVVTVTASATGGRATLTFAVTVYNLVSFRTPAVSVPEGGVAMLVVSLAGPREAPLTVGYTLGPDADPTTADADSEDYVGSGGELTFAAGGTDAAIAIEIVDDDRIEPPREAFAVTLRPHGEVDVGSDVATVTIEEGVCDRSPPVRDALSAAQRGDAGTAPSPLCQSVTAADLAAVTLLDLAGSGISALHAADLSGLAGLRTLWLGGNELAELPAEALAELGALVSLDLSGNRLAALPVALLRNLVRLRSLRLAGNHLATLPAGVFRSQEALSSLDISDNALASLPPSAFAGLDNLRSLQLAGNLLEALPEQNVWADLAELRRLSLPDNTLASLPEGALGSLEELRYLDIGDNKLETVPIGAFKGLERLATLRLAGNRLENLPEASWADLPALRRLDLSGNDFESLPIGLFAGITGITGLHELDLRDNPGAPFALTMALVRTDAQQAASGPATLQARVAAAAPFPMRARLTLTGGVLDANGENATSTMIAAGGDTAGPFTVTRVADASFARAELAVAPMPDSQCGDYDFYPCFQGFAPAAGPPLVLFKVLPSIVGTAPARATANALDDYRLTLAPLFQAAAGETLAFEAASDNPELVRARLQDSELIVEASGLSEGVAEITVVATDSDGFAATLRFTVAVEFLPVYGFGRGWRLTLDPPPP